MKNTKQIKYRALIELHSLHDKLLRNFTYRENKFIFEVHDDIYHKLLYTVEVNTEDSSYNFIDIYTYSINNSNIIGKVQNHDFIIKENFLFQLFDTGVMNGKYILKGSVYDENKKEFGNSYILIEINSTDDFIIKEY